MDGCIEMNCVILKKLRKEYGYSQEKLAQVCYERNINISIATVKRAEVGKSVLYRTATEFAKLYNVPMSDLSALENESYLELQLKR